MSTAATAVQYGQALAKEHALLQRFVELLEEEQKALVEGVNDALPALADRKTLMSNELLACEQERARHQVRAGVGADKASIAAWLSQSAPDAAVEWTAFLELVARAKELNDLNGRLIGERMSNNQQAIHALMAAANRTATYGPKGQSLTGNVSRSLGSA